MRSLEISLFGEIFSENLHFHYDEDGLESDRLLKVDWMKNLGRMSEAHSEDERQEILASYERFLGSGLMFDREGIHNFLVHVVDDLIVSFRRSPMELSKSGAYRDCWPLVASTLQQNLTETACESFWTFLMDRMHGVGILSGGDIDNHLTSWALLFRVLASVSFDTLGESGFGGLASKVIDTIGHGTPGQIQEELVVDTLRNCLHLRRFWDGDDEFYRKVSDLILGNLQKGNCDCDQKTSVASRIQGETGLSTHCFSSNQHTLTDVVRGVSGICSVGFRVFSSPRRHASRRFVFIARCLHDLRKQLRTTGESVRPPL